MRHRECRGNVGVAPEVVVDSESSSTGSDKVIHSESGGIGRVGVSTGVVVGSESSGIGRVGVIRKE